jgi:dTDP-4-amino-4,6-dideoxygalactose transaminase
MMASIGISVPQANPGASYWAAQAELDEAIMKVLRSDRYILGDAVETFEGQFSAWLGTSSCIGCGSGTDALVLALRGLGIGMGDAVATVSHTAVATVAAIEITGAVPVLLDVEASYYTMDPTDLDATLAHPPAGSPPIRAIIPVHLYGQAAELEKIRLIAARYGAVVVEDCAQAHGAYYHGKKLGTIGNAAAFSFYPTKNLGAFGDAGAVATSDAVLAERLRRLRQYGWGPRYVSTIAGINSRLDEIQAAILGVKLTQLDRDNQRRQKIADEYDRIVTIVGLIPPARRVGCTHVFHQYVLRVPKRSSVQRVLGECGVGTSIHYPVPIHAQPAYLNRIAIGTLGCRATEIMASEIISLPMYPELSDQSVELVCAALRML